MVQISVVRLDFPDREIAILQSGDYNGFRSNACQKEPETVEWIRSFEHESVYWDVGASVGPYALIAAALGHSVYSFEPYGPSYGELCRNSIINSLDIHPFPFAIGTGRRIGSMDTVTNLAGAAGKALTRQEGSRSLPVVTISANDMADEIGVPDHVKIDVDGREIDVIESGKALWPLVKSIMIECSGRNIEDVELILSASGLERSGSWLRSGDETNYLFRRAA